MSFLTRLFGIAPAPVPAMPAPVHSHLASGYMQQPKATESARGGTRRELLRVVLRDTLGRHGIPTSWMAAEVLLSTSRAGKRGVHWRLVVKHWDERLMQHAMALQQSLIKRLLAMDPLASDWLTGISWQLELPDEALCPPMPAPVFWTAQARPEAPADARADLEQLLAVRDADFQQHGDDANAVPADATQPMFLRTEPAKL